MGFFFQNCFAVSEVHFFGPQNARFQELPGGFAPLDPLLGLALDPLGPSSGQYLRLPTSAKIIHG
jgi:hypothetical protein